MAQYATPRDPCRACGEVRWQPTTINGMDLLRCSYCGELAHALPLPPEPEPDTKAARLAKERPYLPGMGTGREVPRYTAAEQTPPTVVDRVLLTRRERKQGR